MIIDKGSIFIGHSSTQALQLVLLEAAGRPAQVKMAALRAIPSECGSCPNAGAVRMQGCCAACVCQQRKLAQISRSELALDVHGHMLIRGQHVAAEAWKDCSLRTETGCCLPSRPEWDRL